MNILIRRICLALAALCFSSPILATGSQTYVGPGFAFGLTPPVTWNEARPGFAPVLFHPKGTKSETSPSVIYVRPVDKGSVGVRTAQDLNALDLRGMRQRWPSILSKPLAPVLSADKNRGMVYEFVGGMYYERVAYFDQGKTMLLFVLSTENASPTARDLNAWKSVVESYRWLPELAGR